MPFDYYQRLKPWEQKVYNESDAISQIALPDALTLAPSVAAIQQFLREENRRKTETATRQLCFQIADQLGCRRPQIKVLSARPSDDYEELHGLYEYGEGEIPLISVWMRTAQHKRVVAIRSYLRTVLHELCHHLDYEHLNLRESFHTKGFYQRESSLFNQIADCVDIPRANNSNKSNNNVEVARRVESPVEKTPRPYIEDNRDW